MQIKQFLTEQYLAISDEKGKALFLNDIVTFLLETNVQKADNNMLIKTERDNLQKKVNRAQTLIDEANAEIVKAKRGVINDTKRKLQITRDRLVVVAATSNILGTQINSSTDTSIMMDTLNNIISSVGIVAEELTNLGLWDTDDIKPIITPLENASIANMPIKDTNKKKTSPKVEDETNNHK